MLPQTILTLNLLRTSRINPKLSAYAQVFGQFDFNATPLAPLGTRAIIFEERSTRPTTFADHGAKGWYIGPCLQKYRNYKVWTIKTRESRESNRVDFFPTKSRIPNTNTGDRLAAALEDLNHELKAPAPVPTQIDHGTPLNRAIRQLKTLLGTAVDRTTDTIQAILHPNPLENEDTSSPRVHENAPPRVNPNASPRVSEARGRYGAGTKIVKMFKGKPYRGAIKKFSHPWYRIEYEDGDEEDLTHNQVTKLVCDYRASIEDIIEGIKARNQPAPQEGNSVLQEVEKLIKAKPEDRKNRLGNSYSKFSGGYGNALKLLVSKNEMMTNIALDDLRDSTDQAYAITHPVTGKQMEYKDLIKDEEFEEVWKYSMANELGRLAQGVGKNSRKEEDRIKGTDTIFFIRRDQVPQGRKVTYARTVCTYRPEKTEKNRTRITAGGNLLTDYPGEISTDTAGLELIKIHWNSVISTPGARYMTMDISNMYLNTPLDRYEYMRMNIKDLPQEIIDEHNLKDLADKDGWVYMEIRRAMYGLRQSGALAGKQLAKILGEEGYYQAKHTTGLWLHETRPISFTLVVDDFGVKYVNKEDAEHLESVIKKNYPMKSDWKGDRYIGIHLDWNYKLRELVLSMPGYVKKALLQFEHEIPKKHQYAPSKYTPPEYGKKVQMATIDDSDPMNKEQIKKLEQVCGKFLYYARAVDDTMLHALNDLATQKNDGTQKTVEALIYFLNYCASNPDAMKLYRASGMILTIDSDAAYLVAKGARSRAGGFHYLGNKEGTMINGSIAAIAKIIKNVMASAAEAEVAALYMNARLAVSIRIALIELGHPQPATKIKTDNTTADGIINGTIKQHRSKAIDMRFYWLKDRAAQGQFHIYWAPGQHNFADYQTKIHPPSTHRILRPIWQHDPNNKLDMQGCIKLLESVAPNAKRARLSRGISTSDSLDSNPVRYSKPHISSKLSSNPVRYSDSLDSNPVRYSKPSKTALATYITTMKQSRCKTSLLHIAVH